MKKFLIQGFLFVIIIELLFRLAVDPFYYFLIDTFIPNKKAGFSVKNLYFNKKNNLDNDLEYLFLGSSRMPASLNVDLINKQKGKIAAVNAGRGYMTGGISYLGLKKKLKQDKEYLKNVIVIAELQGTGEWVYTHNYKKGQFTTFEDQPHLILPHLNFRNYTRLLLHLHYDLSYKATISRLYLSGFYRGIPFVRDKVNEKIESIFNNDKEKKNDTLTNEGGIITDEDQIELTRKIIIDIAENRIKNQIGQKPFNKSDLDNSMLNEIFILIRESGGTLVLLDMPQHAMQQKIFETELNVKNKATLYDWLQRNNIPIITLNDFRFNNLDFPDYMHLAKSRRNEFTQLVYKQLEKF